MKTFTSHGSSYNVSLSTSVLGNYEVVKTTPRMITTVRHFNDAPAYDYCDIEDDDDTTPNPREKRIRAQRYILDLFRM